nr:hypothetical protein [Clostridium acidisoli]
MELNIGINMSSKALNLLIFSTVNKTIEIIIPSTRKIKADKYFPKTISFLFIGRLANNTFELFLSSIEHAPIIEVYAITIGTKFIRFIVELVKVISRA